MSTKNIFVRIQNARDTKTNWEANNPLLLDGELATVWGAHDDVNKPALKIGNGEDKFNSLDYFEDETKIPVSEKGTPNGVATLDAQGKIPESQLPLNYTAPAQASADGDVIIQNVPAQMGVLVYNGKRQMPMMSNFDLDAFIISGTIEAVDTGEYTMIFTPAPGYVWPDGSKTSVMVKWAIT